MIRSRKKKTKQSCGIKSPVESETVVQTKVENETVEDEHDETADIKEVAAKTSKSRIPVLIQNRELVFKVQTKTTELEQSDEILTENTQLVEFIEFFLYIL